MKPFRTQIPSRISRNGAFHKHSNGRQYSKKNINDNTTISSNVSLNNALISHNQGLYMTHKYSPGSIFFLPNGAKIFNKLVNFIKIQETQKLGFKEVMTPLIYKKELFEISNHWKYYNEDMFKIERHSHGEDSETYGLKPMNCPGHCLIYKQFPKKFSDLPVKFSDFSSLHRNEATGALSGLTRVRRFHQDDGHVFCGFEHLKTEILDNLKLVQLVYDLFGLGDFKVLLSTRPKGDESVGNAKDWDKAEGILKEILTEYGKPWQVNEGDGAFYGPKIDIILKDKYGKYHQSATIQLDFQLPKSFELSFQNPTGHDETPIIIHRAIFGSVERFMAILLDHYNGKWPFWLNSHQIKVIPVSPEKHLKYSQYIEHYFKTNGASDSKFELFQQPDKFSTLSPLTTYEFNIEIDSRAEPMGKRIKDAYKRSFNYLITVGDKEVAEHKLSIKNLHTNQTELLTKEQALAKFIALEKTYQ